MTNAELAILSLVAEHPRHGYEIEQVIQQRGMREWTEIGFSSIYYLLAKLDGASLIVSRLEEGARGPARKVYEATPAGRQALREGALELLAVPHRSSSLELGLANLPLLDPAEALAALRRYRDALVGRKEHVLRRREAQRPLPDLVEALFDHSLTMIQADLDWVERYISQQEERDK